MKIDNSFALAVSIAIAVSLAATMNQAQAEADKGTQTPGMESPTQIQKVNINNSLMKKAPSRAKLQTMSAKETLALDSAGTIKLTVVERKSLKDKINVDKIGRTVMCPW